MANVKYGQTKWGEGVGEDSGRGERKDFFMRLQTGKNPVRIVTAPFVYTVHRYKKEGDPGFGTRIKCSMAHNAPNGSCPVCALGDKPKKRWLIGVIDRRSGSFKLLDIGPKVFKDITNLSEDDGWGDPIKYDVDIKVDPNGGATNYYAVTPTIPKPLSADDIEIRDTIDYDEIHRLCTPPTPEKAQEILDKALTGTPLRSATPQQKRPAPVQTAPQRVAPVPAVESSEEDDDFSFPQAPSN